MPTQPSPLDQHKYNGDYAGTYNYHGHAIHAGEGIHEHAMEQINKKYKKNVSILVLGSGTGSFDCRLFENGFKHITSVDINTQNYNYRNDKITHITQDLNTNFATNINQTFDVIVAIEIIEHLYSTHNFLNNCSQLLRPLGDFLITTPNPRSLNSRWRFLLTGFHNGFIGTPILYEHINPIHLGILKHHCHFNGLELSKITSVNHEFKSTVINNIIKKCLSFLLKITDLILNNDLQNENKSILFLQIRKQGQNGKLST